MENGVINFWGSPTGIIHKQFHIRMFHCALVLNNSCLVSIFIGIWSTGVICHCRQPWYWYPMLMLVVRVFRGRAGGRKQKKEACGFVTLTSGPPISGKEAAQGVTRLSCWPLGKDHWLRIEWWCHPLLLNTSIRNAWHARVLLIMKNAKQQSGETRELTSQSAVR